MDNNNRMQELLIWINKFEQCFNEIPPTRQILSSHTPEELIDAIKACLESGINNLPDIYGYKDLPSDVDC